MTKDLLTVDPATGNIDPAGIARSYEANGAACLSVLTDREFFGGSMDDLRVGSTARANFNMVLLTLFGGAALLLAAIGIYGLMAYSVEQRTQEMGIRLALGADALRVRNMIVWQGMRVALAGVVVGVAAALGLTRAIASFLFAVTTRDPLTFVVVPVASLKA